MRKAFLWVFFAVLAAIPAIAVSQSLLGEIELVGTTATSIISDQVAGEYYSITAIMDAGELYAINDVTDGFSYTIQTNTGYVLLDVIIDAISYGPLPFQNFGIIDGSHSISLDFCRKTTLQGWQMVDQSTVDVVFVDIDFGCAVGSDFMPHFTVIDSGEVAAVDQSVIRENAVRLQKTSGTFSENGSELTVLMDPSVLVEWAEAGTVSVSQYLFVNTTNFSGGSF